MNEKLIEKKLREEVQKMGGLSLKFSSPYHTGIPDRIIIMPGGFVCFAEIKSTGKKPTPIQEKAISLLKSYSLKVEVLDCQEDLDRFVKFLERFSC